jgi:hypothetical protein
MMKRRTAGGFAMPSPFPGMNPYLERPAFWPDFHQTYLTHLRESLTALVGDRYFVAIDERVYLHDAEENLKLIGRPDPSVRDVEGQEHPRHINGPSTATIVAPSKVTIPQSRKRKVPYLQVVDAEEKEVVTVIELLSPSNKYAGDDRESYLAKRRELLGSRVNFVELDFLRAGPRMPLKNLPSCDYYAMVSRPSHRPQADIWPLRLRDALPRIPIPLREGEREPQVDLQAVLHRVYDGAGYAKRVYAHEPEPKLAPTDADWAKQLIAAASA